MIKRTNKLQKVYDKSPNILKLLYRAIRTSTRNRILAKSINLIKNNRMHSNTLTNFGDQDLLFKLTNKYKPTKADHDYMRHYELHFSKIRLQVKAVLEIGVQTDKSISLWKEYFPNAIIYGVDIDEKCKIHESEKIKIIIADQGSAKDLQQIVDTHSKFDIIIDDGSHQPDHQILTFEYLFPHLNPGGIYVIEDMGGIVGDYGLKTHLRISKEILGINKWDIKNEPKNWKTSEENYSSDGIIGISFYRWITFIQK
jgi:hypothetical protein